MCPQNHIFCLPGAPCTISYESVFPLHLTGIEFCFSTESPCCTFDDFFRLNCRSWIKIFEKYGFHLCIVLPLLPCAPICAWKTIKPHSQLSDPLSWASFVTDFGNNCHDASLTCPSTCEKKKYNSNRREKRYTRK
jgi:hypothetical protein